MELKSLIFSVVDDEERGCAIMVVRKLDSGRVLRQIHVYYNPTHLHKRNKQQSESRNTKGMCLKIILITSITYYVKNKQTLNLYAHTNIITMCISAYFVVQM